MKAQSTSKRVLRFFESMIFFYVLFVFASGLIAGEESVPAFLAKFPREIEQKLVSEGRVVGRQRYTWTTEANLLRFDEESELKLTLFKKLQDIVTSGRTWTDAQLQIQKISFQMKSAESRIEISGEKKGAKLHLKISQAGQVQQKDLETQEPMVTSALIRPFLLMKGLSDKPVERTAMMLEPSALTIVPFKIRISKKSKEVWNIDINYLQHRMLSEMTADGRVIKETSDFAGMPVEALPLESKESKTLKIEGSRGDLVELAKVQYPSISNSRDLKNLSVKISGVDLKSFQLTRHRQTLKSDRLTISVETLPTIGLPYQSLIDKPEMEAYLKGDALTEVNDPAIQKQSLQIVGAEKDLLKRALLIKDFVYRTLEKTPTVSVPNALEVLKSKKGDCNEHSVLFTALARAAHIPTRTVVGLVYSLGSHGAPGFFYHAWVEVFTGKEWLALDPTWNQAPADATHMAFVEGGLEQQVLVTSLMGKIKLSPADPVR